MVCRRWEQRRPPVSSSGFLKNTPWNRSCLAIRMGALRISDIGLPRIPVHLTKTPARALLNFHEHAPVSSRPAVKFRESDGERMAAGEDCSHNGVLVSFIGNVSRIQALTQALEQNERQPQQSPDKISQPLHREAERQPQFQVRGYQRSATLLLKRTEAARASSAWREVAASFLQLPDRMIACIFHEWLAISGEARLV